MPEERWEEIGAAAELANTPLQQLTIGKTKIALIHRDGEFHAISGVCNHVGGPLGEGRLEGDYVVCPWHNWKFHWQTGHRRAGLRRGRGAGLRDARRRRPPLRRHQSAHEADAQAARAASAGAARRAPRRPAARGRHLDHGDGQRQSALLDVRRAARALAHARARGAGLRDATAAPQRAQVPPLRGLLLEERAGLHLAVLDHADGPRRSARSGLRGDRALGRRVPGRRRRSAGAAPRASTTRWSSA